MNQSFSFLLSGGLIRIFQGFAAAAPTLLVGLLIAAILKYYLGDKATRRLFGGDSLRGLPQSWLVGMLLPVCSIGVLPILRQMQRVGVKPGAMSAFALSAPLFNPLSLLYGLTLSRPLVIIMFALGSLAIVTALGLLWDRMAEAKRETEPSTFGPNASATDGGSELAENRLQATEQQGPEQQGPEQQGPGDHLIGLRRVVATFVHFTRELTGAGVGLTLVALLGLALLAAVLPFGAMQKSVEQDDLTAPLTMTAVSIPVYATPMLAMSQLGMMFQHANSPGAAFALLFLGTGFNLATPVWFAKNFGFKATAIWMVTLVFIVLGTAYAINGPLIPQGVQPAGHTHAFDIYTNPFSLSETASFSTISDKLTKDFGIGEQVSLAVLATLAVVGLGLRFLQIDQAWLVKHAQANSFASSLSGDQVAQRSGLDKVVSPGVIGVTMLGGLVALSMVACFAYYPSTEECLAEVALARAECLSAANSGDSEHALYWLPIFEDWSRRLEVGTFLRNGQVRPYQRMQGYLIRKKLETLEHELEHDPPVKAEVQQAVRDILDSNLRWVNAFRST